MSVIATCRRGIASAYGLAMTAAAFAGACACSQTPRGDAVIVAQVVLINDPKVDCIQVQVRSPGGTVVLNQGETPFVKGSALYNVAFYQGALPPQVDVQAIGAVGLDAPGCASPIATNVQSATKPASFVAGGTQTVVLNLNPPASSCDLDADGYTSNSTACGGPDCNDTDPTIHPGAQEDCLSWTADRNCNGKSGCFDPTCAGQACDGGNPCFTGDTCVNFACVGTPSPGTVCGSSFCLAKICDSTGACMASDAGFTCDTPPLCKKASGGQCIPSDGGCSYPNNVGNGTACVPDLCHAGTCQNGTCNATETSCTSPGPCKQVTGTCVAFDGGCYYPPDDSKNGQSCTSNPCSPGTCQNGACVTTTVNCNTPPGPCFESAGSCLLDGGCDYPILNGGLCNPGAGCGAGVCQGGVCVATMCNTPPNSVCYAPLGSCGGGDSGCSYTPYPDGTCCGYKMSCQGGTCGADTTPEDCTNGKDDDCDGLIDCQDPACAGQNCGSSFTCCIPRTNCPNFQTDPNNCGACSITCGTGGCGAGCSGGQYCCSAGQCVCRGGGGCPSNQTCTSGDCGMDGVCQCNARDPSTCPQNYYCDGGACLPR
jgi:hypothetical protein